MTWFVYAGNRRLPLVHGISTRVGRDESCDLVVDGHRISREHLTIELDPSGAEWTLTDTSSNGTFGVDGRIRTLTGTSTVVVALGDPHGPVVAISEDMNLSLAAVGEGFIAQGDPRPSASVDVATREASLVMLEGVTRFGRASDNNVVLTGALASAHHAHVLRTEDGLEVVDLATERGTYVNGERISRSVITPGDRVTMGGSAFVVSPDGVLSPVIDSSGVDLQAVNLTVQAGESTILQNVSFSLPARSVLAVVGPSGSGKSTLLGALTAFAPATSGTVHVGGRDLYADYDELRFQIGLVPQADLVPAQLEVRQALDYAARLRFPSDVTAAERQTRISEVLDELGLSQRATLRIDRLSGGQRKRVSVALEMLTRPSLLFLDEPTSGLDPGLDRQVMVLLRELADDGRTVIVVTHSVENISLAHELLVMAPGGYLAYIGPPSAAPEYFGVPDLPSVFLALEHVPGEEWQRRWTDAVSSGRTGPRPVPPESAAGTAATSELRVSRPQGAWTQLRTLLARGAASMRADRALSALLVFLPLVLAVAGALVGNSHGLSPDPLTGINVEARSVLLVLVLGSVFTGAATSIQELVKDRVVYQRERAVGLSRGAYVAAKALLFGAVAALQGAVFAALSLLGRPGPEHPLVLPGAVEIAVIAAVATFASCMLGLLLSVFLTTRDTALPVLVIVTMIQVVFSGAVPLRFAHLQNLLGWAMPGYWEFRAMASSADLAPMLGPAGNGATWPHTAGSLAASLAVLVLMSAVFIWATIGFLARHDPGRRRR